MQTATRHSNGSRLSERQYSLCSEKIDRVENILLNFRLNIIVVWISTRSIFSEQREYTSNFVQYM